MRGDAARGPAAPRTLAIDLFCGLGGWTEGLIAAGHDVIGFDIEQHEYGEHRYPAQLVIQDVLTLHGSQFKDAALIVASPPCTEYSYMAMPWTRAKQIKRALLGEDDFPEGYKGSRTVEELNRLFNACFRIQREACEAAGKHIPMVVENVRGAQEWVGRARWRHGSYYLWGDVPALMPITKRRFKNSGGSWFSVRNDGKRGERNDPRYDDAIKNSGGSWFRVAHNTTSGKNNNPVMAHIKQGGDWFSDPNSISSKTGSNSSKRKMGSAMIAKIPFDLAYHIAKVYRQ